jgi:hypothetical protein
MAIPSFGFLKIEALACILMVAAGVAGLLLVLPGSSDWILSTFGEKWAPAHVSSLWLVLQSLAVIVGGIGAWRSASFVAAAVGVASSLIARTAVGHISFLPGLLMLYLMVTRFRAFSIFWPRWRGQGPPPPGAWRG